MLYNYIRILSGNDGTITDLSLDNQDESSTLPAVLVSGEDYIYVGQYYPFNNFFYQSDTANTNAAVMALEYWCGLQQGWKSAVDILDGTSTAGKTLARSGVVQFSPNEDYRWQSVVDQDSTHAPTDLSTVVIPNVYWLRISVSADMSAGTAATRFVYSFTRSQQLDNLDTTIDQFLTSFSSGKTNWDDEVVTASIQLVSDLKRRGLVLSNGQILRFDDVSQACDYRTLMLIYKNLGPAYIEKLKQADFDYRESLNSKRFSFDMDNNALVGQDEINNTITTLVR